MLAPADAAVTAAGCARDGVNSALRSQRVGGGASIFKGREEQGTALYSAPWLQLNPVNNSAHAGSAYVV